MQQRWPSNLRPTSRKCIHSVMWDNFWSRGKDVSHTTRSAIADNPMLQANLTTLCFRETKLLLIDVLHCRNFAPVTFTLTQWCSHTNMTGIPWRCTGCANINFLRQVIVWQTYIQTDRKTWPKLYTMPLRGWSKRCIHLQLSLMTIRYWNCNR